jgi:hypothetical protein
MPFVNLFLPGIPTFFSEPLPRFGMSPRTTRLEYHKPPPTVKRFFPFLKNFFPAGVTIQTPIIANIESAYGRIQNASKENAKKSFSNVCRTVLLIGQSPYLRFKRFACFGT